MRRLIWVGRVPHPIRCFTQSAPVVPTPLSAATTSTLAFLEAPAEVPMYQVVDPTGAVSELAFEAAAQPPTTTLRKILTTMIQQRSMDRVLLGSQRQGRLSFYLTATGEEAISVAAAAALSDDDEVFLQYREAGLCLYRGLTISQLVSQCMGNIENIQKGRQMPVHYGSAKHHIQMISSPLGTQIPQAAGAGYGFRIAQESRICACFLGDGAASEGDFHAGLNFAATLGSQTLFVVRNNGFAISTPISEQFSGSIANRGAGYGIPVLRVDGNDAIAVYTAVAAARRRILERRGPVLIEAISYRAGDHSTSDDSTRYRPTADIANAMKLFCPILRLQRRLEQLEVWTGKESETIEESAVALTQAEVVRQEHLPPWPVHSIMDDIFFEPTAHLRAQREELLEHYNAHKDVYTAH